MKLVSPPPENVAVITNPTCVHISNTVDGIWLKATFFYPWLVYIHTNTGTCKKYESFIKIWIDKCKINAVFS